MLKVEVMVLQTAQALLPSAHKLVDGKKYINIFYSRNLQERDLGRVWRV